MQLAVGLLHGCRVHHSVIVRNGPENGEVVKAQLPHRALRIVLNPIGSIAEDPRPGPPTVSEHVPILVRDITLWAWPKKQSLHGRMRRQCGGVLRVVEPLYDLDDYFLKAGEIGALSEVSAKKQPGGSNKVHALKRRCNAIPQTQILRIRPPELLLPECTTSRGGAGLREHDRSKKILFVPAGVLVALAARRDGNEVTRPRAREEALRRDMVVCLGGANAAIDAKQ